ncbi:hypothetical protein SSP35_05_04560 [Streptomyces sp. NBRC 110611]|nr:hypothetical protein SSP35_05_04560 [Streptomyces sp. NBRC 110611]
MSRHAVRMRLPKRTLGFVLVPLLAAAAVAGSALTAPEVSAAPTAVAEPPPMPKSSAHSTGR